MEELVESNVRNGFAQNRRTTNSDFWRAADFTGYALTQNMMTKSINAILPKLTSRASETAEVFSKCQNILTHAKQNSERSVEQKQKQQNLHIIINFTTDSLEYDAL